MVHLSERARSGAEAPWHRFYLDLVPSISKSIQGNDTPWTPGGPRLFLALREALLLLQEETLEPASP